MLASPDDPKLVIPAKPQGGASRDPFFRAGIAARWAPARRATRAVRGDIGNGSKKGAS